MTLDNGTDGQTDRQTDRQSATQYAAPPREEGRIIMCKPTTLLHALLRCMFCFFLSILYVTLPGRILLPVRALVRVCDDEQSTR